MKGLDNLGNTCYFNSSLQCLFQVPQLSNFMILKNYTGNDEFIKEYQSLVRKVWVSEGGSITPNKLLELFRKRWPQFNSDDQHDSQEAFLCLLDILDKSLCDVIKFIFYSKVIQETVHKNGRSIKTESTPVTILSSKSGETLEQSLKRHQDWSVLEGFKDDNGVVHHVATTRTLFWELPKILVFTTRMYGEKVKVKVSELLNMKPFMAKGSASKNIKYELFACCKHHGSAHGGHYVAYTKHRGEWYIKNDGLCMKTSLPTEDYFYVLLYKVSTK